MHKAEEELKLPREGGVDKVLAHPDCHELHVRACETVPFAVVPAGQYTKLGAGSRPGAGAGYGSDVVTHWVPLRVDYIIGSADLICIEDCYVDTAPRPEEQQARYMTRVCHCRDTPIDNRRSFGAVRFRVELPCEVQKVRGARRLHVDEDDDGSAHRFQATEAGN